MSPQAAPNATPPRLAPILAFLQQHFVSRLRHDIKALYFPPPPGAAKGGYRPEKAEVSTLDLERHVLGSQPLGLYTMDPAHDGRVRAAVVDLDDKARDLTWTQLCMEGTRIAQMLEVSGLLAWPCVSGSGHGLHLWLLWDEWQAAEAVRAALLSAVGQAAVSAHVDIFPAQARLNGGMGNLVALPLARASRPVDLATGAVVDDLYSWQPVSPALSWPVASLTGPLSGDELALDAGRGLGDAANAADYPCDVDTLAGALRWLPADDYQAWMRYGLALKGAAQAGQLKELEAYRLWDNWAIKAPEKYDSRRQEREWRGFKPRGGAGAVTIASIWHDAKEAGWMPGLLGPRLVATTDQWLTTGGAMAQQQRPPEAATEADELLENELAWQKDTGDGDTKRLNEKHFIARDGGKVMLFIEEYDSELARKMLTKVSVPDFKVYYQNQLRFIPGLRGRGGKTRSIAEIWLESPYRRTYRQIVLKPGKDDACEAWQYNLWQGWSIEPSPTGSWSLLNDHMFNNICRGDTVAYEYVFNWLAFTFQRPAEPIGTAIVLRGNKGSGKSSFVRAFGELFSKHFLQVTSSKSLTGQFNSHLRGCIMLFADEAVWAGNKADESTLKAYITEPQIMIEGKGRDTIACRNMLHIIMATNHEWSAPTSADERRFCCLNVADGKQGNSTFFKAMQKQLMDGGSARLLHDLLTRDIRGFNPQHVPATDELLEQKLLGLSIEGKWWFHRLNEGTLLEDGGMWEGEVPASQLYQDYVKFCQAYGERSYLGSPEWLKKAIERRLMGMTIASTKKRVMIHNVSRSTTVWIFPPVEIARASFAESLKAKFNWVDVVDIKERAAAVRQDDVLNF